MFLPGADIVGRYMPDVNVKTLFWMLSTTHVHGCVLWRHAPGRLNVRFKCHCFLWNALAHVIYTGVSLAHCFPDQCACHILLVAVRIWRTLMFYPVLPSAVRHRQAGHTQLGDYFTFVAHRLPESAALRAGYVRHCFHGLLF